MSIRSMRKTCENSLHSSLQGPTEGCKRNSVSWILNSKSLSWEVFQFAIAFSNKKQKNNLFFFFFFHVLGNLKADSAIRPRAFFLHLHLDLCFLLSCYHLWSRNGCSIFNIAHEFQA